MSTTVKAGEGRIENMVVIRESDRNDRLLMQGMIEQTLRKASSVPEAAEMLKAGLRVLDQPSTYGGHTITSPGSRTVVAERGSTVFVYSMGSAATTNESGENAFVKVLIDQLRRYRPRHLWAAEVSRLLRAYRFSGELFSAARECVDIIHAETDMDLNTPAGQLLWSTFSTLASTERDNILRRTLIGLIHQWRRGEWIIDAIPPGYRKVDGYLEVDPSAVEVVRKAIPIITDPTLTAEQKCERLGQIGLTRPTIQKLHGAKATYADVLNPGSAIASLARWLPAWESGIYVVRRMNPFPRLESLVDMPVHQPADDEKAGYPHGFFEFRYELPLPPGGWAAPDVFAQGRDQRVRTRRILAGGKAHRLVKPLASVFQWTDTVENAVFASKANYAWYQRPTDPKRVYRGWFGKDNRVVGDRVAVVPAAELHRSIAHGVADAIGKGCPAELLESDPIAVYGQFWENPLIGSTASRLRALRTQLAEATEAGRRARRNANRTDDEILVSAFLDDAKAYLRKAKRLEAEIAELEEARRNPVLGSRIETVGALAAQALAKLSMVENSAPGEIRSALATIFRDARLSLDGDDVVWTLYVHLPTASGRLRLGPISGKVPNKKPSPSVAPKHPLEGLIATKAMALVRLMPAQVRERLTEAVLGLHGGEDVDSFGRHLAQTYTHSGFNWKSSQWSLDPAPRQRVVDFVLANGGRMSVSTLQASAIRSHRYDLYSIDDGRVGSAVLRRAGRWRKGTATPDRRLEVIKCPHCDGYASVVVLVPEVPTGVICPDCRRMPIHGSPVFPELYLRAHEAYLAARDESSRAGDSTGKRTVSVAA